jgi:hypothetical protein
MLADASILKSLTNTVDDGFEEAYNAIAHPDKAALRSFLIYFDKVWNHMLPRDIKEDFRFMHFHFPEMDWAMKEILLEFIILKQFYLSLKQDRELSTYVTDQISRLQTITKKSVPEGAAGGSRSYKKWVFERTAARERINILKKLPHIDKSFMPDTILNLQQNALDVFKESLYTVVLDALKNQQKRAYCLVNTDLSLERLSQELDDKGYLNKIRRIILFDCDHRTQFQGYNRRMIEHLNADGCSINTLMLLSFDKRQFRLSKFLNRIGSIYQRYDTALQPSSHLPYSYVFHEREMCELLSGKDSLMVIEWLGGENEIFYDYLEISREYGLDKLRSIGVLNIFSMALNKAIAEKILQDLYSQNVLFDMFSDELRSAINALDVQEKGTLKTIIIHMLDRVSDIWKGKLEKLRMDSLCSSVAFVLPFQFVKTRSFRKEWKSVFPQLTFKLYGWNSLRNGSIKETKTYILAYRDAGRAPFDLFPNILENDTGRSNTATGIFISMFFHSRYERFIYPYLSAWNKILANDFRYKHMEWNKIDSWISKQRIKQEEVLFEADDHEYGLAEPSEMVRVEYADKTHASFYPSRQLITRKKGSSKLKVLRADDLTEEYSGCEIQPLEDIHEDLNLFDITSEERRELVEIKHFYGVMDDQELWKVLLIRKLEEGKKCKGLYDELHSIIGSDDPFVRFEHFRNQWLNPESALLIPRKRKHFKSICQYLGLPGAYYRLKLKKRASLVANSRQSNGQMNALLSQMFNEGLFDSNVDWETISVQHLMDMHELEEKGFALENLNSELKAMVDLLKEKVQLKEVLKLEVS